MKKHLAAFAAAFLVLLLLSASAFAQTGNGTMTGIVEDPQKALIPGVSITATNTETGVTTSVISNESGAYNIPSLIPGSNRPAAELPGFKGVTHNNIDLGINETKRFNLTLQVGVVAQSVDAIDAAALFTT